MTQPAGDLPADELAQLRKQLDAFPRLPLIPDEQQGGDEDGPNGTYHLAGILVNSTEDAIAGGADHFEEIGSLYPVEATALTIGAVNALPRLLAEIGRRRAEDQALSMFRRDGDLVGKLAKLVGEARAKPVADCDMCRVLNDMCSTHIAEALIGEVRDQRLVILTAEAANEVVRDLQQRAKRDEDAPDATAIAEALRRDGFSDPLPAKGQVWELPLAYLEPQQRHLSMVTAISKTTAGWQCRVQAWIEDPRSRSVPERRDGVLYVAQLVDQYRPVWCPVPHPDGDPTRPCTKRIPKGWAQEDGHAGGHMWMTEDTAAIFDGGHYDAAAAVSGQPFSGHLPEDCTPSCPKWFPL